jgi:divalent metal cation (Fe/Co/Zn/Cd) transporter
MKHTDDYGNDEPAALIVAVVLMAIMIFILWQALERY